VVGTFIYIEIKTSQSEM